MGQAIENINMIFIRGYPFIGYLSAVAVVLLLVLTLVDIVSFMISEISESAAMSMNPNLLNKEAIDYILLEYSKNIKEKEPYTIFLQQKVVITIFWLFAAILVYCVLHFAIVFTLYIYSAFKKSEKTIDPSSVKLEVGDNKLDKKAFFSILTMLSFAIVASSYYHNRFVMDIKPELVETSNNLKSITDAIYDNISTDELFLKSVIDKDTIQCYKIINKQGDRVDKIGGMIFTLSLYSYYNNNTSLKFNEDIKSIFTRNQIKLRNIDPYDYLYYNQTTFIPNLYQSIESYIKDVLNTPAKRSAVRQNVNTRINDVNRRLARMFRMSSIRSSIRLYMTMCAIIAIIFFIIIVLIYLDDIMKVFREFFVKNKKIPPE